MEYLFADLTLDPGRRELRRGSEPVDVAPQVFDLLVYLVQNRDRVVSKDDLIATVWGGRIVSESTLISHIHAARKAVGDSGETQEFIRTVQRKGVRFIGTVRMQSGAGVQSMNEQFGPSDLTSKPPVPSKQPVPADTAPRQTTTRKYGWMLVGGLAAAMAIYLFQQFAPPMGTPAAKQSGLEDAKAASSSLARAISIAVLPFLNLSGDAGQDFFSDGITEEISATLARVPDLRVVARTSAFQFKAQNRDVQGIARQLRATHLIEGSIRREGERVRITAQLIDASTGVRVSSETYDRQLSDILSTQEDIARNIVGALMAPLGLAPGERLITNRTIDPESYQQFLHAKALVPRRFEGLTEAIKLLEPVVARDPDFAPAWAQLAMAYQRIPFFSPRLQYATVEEKRRATDEWVPKAEAAAERAIGLDDNFPDGYSAFGLIRTVQGRFLEAEGFFSKALALDPLYPEALHSYANLLGAVGRTEEALAMRRQLLSLEPFVLIYHSGVEDLLWISGQTDTVIANLRVTRSPVDLAYLAKIYSAQGREKEAVDAIMAIPAASYPEGMLDSAVRLLSGRPADAFPLRSGPRLGRRLNFVYIKAGAPERALERFEDDVAARYSAPNLTIDLWTPIYAPVRGTERFKAFARDAGLVEYWRAKGWPGLCRPVGDDDFVCD